MEYRIEHDSLGEVRVPADHMWGAQTQRSFENFKIGHVMPKEIIRAFAILKKCAAKVNEERGALAAEKGEAIRSACDEILAGKWEGEFPLVVYQTGSGTQSNMNMNEVVAHIANRKLERREALSVSIPMMMSIWPSLLMILFLLPSMWQRCIPFIIIFTGL